MVRFNYVSGPLVDPAPFAQVILRNPVSPSLEVPNSPAQIDSGADRTIIPASFVPQLGLPVLDYIEVGGLGGAVARLPTYAVLLEVRSLRPLAVEVVAADGEHWVLLGRDVINHFRTLLDGPGSILEIT